MHPGHYSRLHPIGCVSEDILANFPKTVQELSIFCQRFICGQISCANGPDLNRVAASGELTYYPPGREYHIVKVSGEEDSVLHVASRVRASFSFCGTLMAKMIPPNRNRKAEMMKIVINVERVRLTKITPKRRPPSAPEIPVDRLL